MKLKYLLSILVFSVTLTSVDQVYAQKRKKKKRKKVEKIDTPISEKDRLEALSFFFDGQKFFMLEDHEKALSSLKKSLSIDPTNAAASFKIGQVYLSQGKYNDALLYAQKAKEINNHNEYYYQLEASAYSGLGDFDRAAATYEGLLKKTGVKGEYLFELGALYLYSEKYEEAADAYERAKLFYGPNEQITKQKQSIYLRQNMLAKAIAEGKELIKAYPEVVEYKLGLAEILLTNKKGFEAEKLVLRTKKVHPENSKADVMLSEIYRKRGELKKSIETLIEPFGDPSLDFSAKLNMLGGYITLLPNDSLKMPMLTLARVLPIAHPTEVASYSINGDINLNVQKKDSALSYYKKSVQIDKSNFNVWQNIIQIESEKLQYDSVIIHANEAIEYFPNQALLYYYLGMGNYVKKEYQEAIIAYENGRKFSRKDPKLSSIFSGQLGDAYHQLEQYEKSYESYEDALRADPNNDHVLNNYSYFLSLKKEKIDRALEMSSLLVKNHPDNSTYLDTHAWVLYIKGDYAGALVFLEKAVVGTQNGTILEHYGDVLYQLNRVDEAIEQWKKAKNTKDELTEFIDKKITHKKLYE